MNDAFPLTHHANANGQQPGLGHPAEHSQALLLQNVTRRLEPLGQRGLQRRGIAGLDEGADIVFRQFLIHDKSYSGVWGVVTHGDKTSDEAGKPSGGGGKDTAGEIGATTVVSYSLGEGRDVEPLQQLAVRPTEKTWPGVVPEGRVKGYARVAVGFHLVPVARC